MKTQLTKSLFLFFLTGLLYAGLGCGPCARITDLNTNRNLGVTVLGQDIVYAQRQVYDLKTQQMVTIDLKMDIVAPPLEFPASATLPLVVFFHGENLLNYYRHSKESYKYYYLGHRDLMLKFAQKFKCVVALVNFVSTTLKWEESALNYLSSASCSYKSKTYMPLIDSIEEKRELYFMVSQGKDAVRFLKSKQTEYKIDISNITVAGFSAGGMIAAGVGFMDDADPKPSFAGAQPSIVYNNTNKYPCDGFNLILKCLNHAYNKSYAEIPATFSAPVPRPDLGLIRGSNISSFDSKVNNVVLFCTGLKDPIKISRVGPRLFIYGHDDDGTLKNLRNESAVSCTNTGAIKIFNDIQRQAESAGYVQGNNLRVLESNKPDHDYVDGPLEGRYITPIDAAWDFIR